MTFDNIQQAMGQQTRNPIQNTVQNPVQNGMSQNPQLSPQERAESYRAFEEMTRSGVSVSALLKRLQDAESRLDRLDRERNGDVFGAMERSVRDDPRVKDAKRRLDEAMRAVVVEMCMRDQTYRGLDDEYRSVVCDVYRERADAPTKPRDGD